MALLNPGRAALPCALLLLLGGQVAAYGAVKLELYDRPVSCHPNLGQCTDGPDTAVPEYLTGKAFFSENGSRHPLGGLYVFIEFTRPGGATAVLELDLPTSPAPRPAAVLAYREYSGAALVFEGSIAHGVVELPAHLFAGGGSSCTCHDGRLALEFVDPGPDGAPNTGDDLTRRVSRGLFGKSAAFCRSGRLFALTGAVSVIPATSCPTGHDLGGKNTGPAGGAGGSPGRGDDGGCEVEDDPGTYQDDGGCGGDEEGWDDSGEGCEADSAEWEDSGEGCEGDSADWGDSSEGCEGDSTDWGDSDCEGDAWAAAGTRRGGPGGTVRRHISRLAGTMGPIILLAMFHCFQKRRRRRRGPGDA